MQAPRLYMVLLGCTPPGRLTEQHDVFFGIAHSLVELIPAMNRFWPEAKGQLHIDSWREVTQVGVFKINVIAKSKQSDSLQRLFFINLGGYKPNDLEEYHYKLLIAAANKTEAIQQAKQTTFYKHTGFTGAVSHLDDKYGVDVDDSYEIADILAGEFKSNYSLEVIPGEGPEDLLHIGYVQLSKLEKQG